MRYQFIAALGIQLGALARPARDYPLKLLLIGHLCFSGSLYLLLLTEQRWLGPITPLGGLGMITCLADPGLRGETMSSERDYDDSLVGHLSNSD